MRRLVQVAICVALVWFGVLEYGGGLTGGMGHAGDSAIAGATEIADSSETAGRFKMVGMSDAIGKSSIVDISETDGRPGKQLLGEKEINDPKAVQGAAAEYIIKHQAAVGGKTVYLTFDDGPSKHTPDVLDILKKEGIKATFFVLGEQVERNPDIARRIVEEGHSIGNHTFNHIYGQLYGGFGAFADQIMKTDDAIYAAAGVRTNLVRAPGGTHGNFDQSYFDALGDAGYIVHDWNVDSGDSKRRGVPASEMVSNVKNSKLGDSLNVLLHDSSGHGELVKALPQIISYYRGLGYAFEAIDSELKPMQFAVASKLKWTRPAAKRDDRDRLLSYAMARTGLDVRSAQPVKPMLYLHYGSGVLELDAASYTLENGSIQVPLDRLMAWLGGTYEQDSKSGIVEASLHGKELFWSGIQAAGDQVTREQQWGMAPIRSTLAMFDMEISDYEMGKERREIWIKS